MYVCMYIHYTYIYIYIYRPARTTWTPSPRGRRDPEGGLVLLLLSLL